MDYLTEQKSPPCLICMFFHGGRTCEAFPNGIPIEILRGLNDHKNKYSDQQNNIVFSKINNKHEALKYKKL